jgi:hypothetical protein
MALDAGRRVSMRAAIAGPRPESGGGSEPAQPRNGLVTGLVTGLVRWMTMHAHEDPSSQDEAHNDRAARGDRSRRGRPSGRELARLRLKETVAYVSIDDLAGLQQETPEPEDDVSSEAGRKRKQRKIDEDAGFHYFNVKMPIKDPALKETVKMVAATLIGDREFHRTLDRLVSNPSLREIIDCAVSAPGDEALIAKAARAGGLLQMGKDRGCKWRTGSMSRPVGRRRRAPRGHQRIGARLQ